MKPILSLLLILTFLGTSQADDSQPAAIIDSYVTASAAQRSRLQGASMAVDIEAEVPNLKKSGSMHALRRISEIGRITYDAFRFEGDSTIKKDVIARYLTAEAEAQKVDPSSLAITPANYKFKYKGLADKDGRRAYIFAVSPRKKRPGLFTGELWIDPDTHLPIRESGRLVKNPSIFVRRVEFVREYQIQDGVALLRRIQSMVHTRLVGKAKLSVAYSEFSLPEQSVTAGSL